MLSDAALVAWLQARHARAAAVRLGHMAGTDVLLDRSSGERVYQAYIAVFAVVCLVLVWFALIDGVERMFAGLGAGASTLAFACAAAVPWLLAAAQGLAWLRTPSVFLRPPDIPFVAFGGVSSRAVVCVQAGAFAAALAAAGALCGFLLGAGMQAGLAAHGAPFSGGPAACALLGGLAFCAAGLFAHFVGAVRLSWAARGRRRARIAVLAAAVAVCAATAAAVCVAASASLAAVPAAWPAACAAAAGFAAALVAALAAVALRIDMTAVVEGNRAAPVRSVWLSLAVGSEAVEDCNRRRRLAQRTPRLRLPKGAQGGRAVAARAALSLARQHEGWWPLAAFGLFVVPFGVWALSGAGGKPALLMWMCAAVMAVRGPREATRAFRDDMRVRLVRDRLPFGTLRLFALDAMPAFAVLAVLVCTGTAAMLAGTAALAGAVGGAGAGAAAGLEGFAARVALGVLAGELIAAGMVLSCGLDAVRLRRGMQPFAEAGWLGIALATGVCSLFGMGWAAAAAAVACAAIAAVIAFGTERAGM